MMNSESNQQQPLPPIDTVTKENTGVHRLPANGDVPRADRVSPIPSTDSPGGVEKRRRLENGTTAKDDEGKNNRGIA